MALKQSFYFLASCTIAIMFSACSQKNDDAAPALPPSWIKTAEAPPVQHAPIEKPSAKTTQAVRAAFRAHTKALSAATHHAAKKVAAHPLSAAPPSPLQDTSDWTPWHLDGMIAAFGVDVGGVFGTLAGDGAIGVKVTWQQQDAAGPAAPAVAVKKTLKFNRRMSQQDLNRMLEPAIRSAVATNNIQDVPTLRRNLHAEASKFLATMQVLDSVPILRGWYIGGYQLALTFNASGMVTPVIGVGGGAALIFDWDKNEGSVSNAPTPVDESQRALQQNMLAFADTITTLIPEARAEAADIRKAGFELQVFQVGLGISAGGTIGIASVAGTAVGRVIFKKHTNTEVPPPATYAAAGKPRKLNLVLAGGSPTDNIGQIREIAMDDFRDGIRRAIDMAAFFARNAVSEDTMSWKVTEIEGSFDGNISGDLTLVTVGGVGLIRLGFERVD